MLCWLVERWRRETGLFGGTVVTKRGTAQADKLVRGKSSGWFGGEGEDFQAGADCDLDLMLRPEDKRQRGGRLLREKVTKSCCQSRRLFLMSYN